MHEPSAGTLGLAFVVGLAVALLVVVGGHVAPSRNASFRAGDSDVVDVPQDCVPDCGRNVRGPAPGMPRPLLGMTALTQSLAAAEPLALAEFEFGWRSP